MILFTAPSGAGKTTIVRHLLNRYDQLAFSVSATTRPPRPHETDKKDYYFMSKEEFNQRVANEEFIEWEEVYEGQYYGTLRAEIERLWELRKCVLFDIEVKGATNIKKKYPEETLAIFVKPPSVETLLSRLKLRRTESAESLRKRITRAKEELTYENKFDRILVNDILEVALKEAESIVEDYLGLKN